MSVRVYTGPHADRGGQPEHWKRLLPWVCAGLAVVFELVSVLLPAPNTWLVGLAIVAGFLATTSHAVFSRGATWAALFGAVTLAFGLAVEAAGATTGFPFGTSVYTASVGPTVLEVPVLVVLSWPLVSYVVLLGVLRLATTTSAVMLGGAWLFAWVNVLNDPVFDPARTSHGSDWLLPRTDIPLQYALGLLLTGIVLFAVLGRLPRKTTNDTFGFTMLSWVYIGGVVGALLSGEPALALWGGVGGAVIMLPLWWKLWSEPNW